MEKADDSIIKSIYSRMISPAEKARVKLLELILSADVTGNPYYVTFNTLTDVVVSSGIWNEADGRIEF